MEQINDLALKNFREYLRIPSVHPNVNYNDCVKFLKQLAEDIDLPIEVIRVKPTKPVVLITWKGERPDLPSILLNSHMDVVPVFEDKWKYKPFAADIDNGKIYARGSQDMKSIGIQYLEAIRRLKIKGNICKRNVHVCFVPDEEIGGEEGMKLFVQSEEFKKLNVGVSFDESYASRTNEFVVFYDERVCRQFSIHCKGASGHGSFLLENTPGEKITYILNKFYEFRDSQRELLKSNIHIERGQVTTINCTRISGGVQDNVIPCEMTISFDCRVPSSNLETFEKMMNQWCKDAGEDCDIEYHQKNYPASQTKLDDSNIYWKAFERVSMQMGFKLKPEICPGTTDSRYLRQIGIPAFGFSPINNTVPLLHAHNEFLRVETFLKGIDVYCSVIYELANIVENNY
ncbi:hypothetical protein HHI36_007705 [Cryptolaemus montrouzieri]|uniref:N-acyl-aliphatic-L-amino acid amidohydrolase n=1 Tax=Cryptolaemus montrouzieri TaxID=559131 RepID=A0ABD2MQJ8_9CUCU